MNSGGSVSDFQKGVASAGKILDEIARRHGLKK